MFSYSVLHSILLVLTLPCLVSFWVKNTQEFHSCSECQHVQMDGTRHRKPFCNWHCTQSLSEPKLQASKTHNWCQSPLHGCDFQSSISLHSVQKCQTEGQAISLQRPGLTTAYKKLCIHVTHRTRKSLRTEPDFRNRIRNVKFNLEKKRGVWLWGQGQEAFLYHLTSLPGWE